MIDVYGIGTANGQKAAIMLEETACEYEIKIVDMFKGEHLAEPFLSLNPIGKIPAIVDRNGEGGKSVTVFETLAIALYLCDKTGHMIPKDARARAEAWEWACVAATDLSPVLSIQFQLTRNIPDHCEPANEYLFTQATRFLKAVEAVSATRRTSRGNIPTPTCRCTPQSPRSCRGCRTVLIPIPISKAGATELPPGPPSNAA